jgi:hypothetical protein
MKYKLDHERWGPYIRKLREDHIELLHKIYTCYGIKPFRSDTSELPENRSKKQYFLERMSWTFRFIESYRPTKEERKKMLPYQKQMSQYKITPKGLKIMVQLGFDIDDEHVMLAAKEILVEK